MIFDINALRQSLGAVEAPTKKPSSQIWLNIGFNVQGVDADGKPTSTFVSLPVGLPLDSMEPMSAKGKNPDWLALVAGKNALLAHVKGATTALEPGAGIVLEGLTVQAYRRNEESVPTGSNENPLVTGLISQLAVAKTG